VKGAASPERRAAEEGASMRVIRDLAELDAKIAECDRAEAVSDDALRAVFGTFRMDPPAALPADPFAPEYRERQLGLYREVAGRPCSTGNEASVFDVERAALRPFPFTTGSGRTAGEHFMAIGFLLRAMALPPNSRVLEFGPGWGNTTTMLAKLGHRVTAVDIEPRSCELLRRRVAREGVEVEAVNADFLWAEGEEARGRFDAALFFECFHHCADHLRLLRALRGALAPGGRVFFAAEPISPGFPMPWGLRLDGDSLWAARKNGRMELGFRDDYFQEALSRTGWVGRKHACPDPAWASVWEAGRREETVLRFAAAGLPVHTQVGQRRNGLIEFLGAEGTGVHGPYIALPRGRYTARLRFRAGWASGGTAVLGVSADNGETRIVSRPFEGGRLAETGMAVEVPFEAAADLSGVEVRLFCRPGFTGALEAVEIAPVAGGG